MVEGSGGEGIVAAAGAEKGKRLEVVRRLNEANLEPTEYEGEVLSVTVLVQVQLDGQAIRGQLITAMGGGSSLLVAIVLYQGVYLLLLVIC